MFFGTPWGLDTIVLLMKSFIALTLTFLLSFSDTPLPQEPVNAKKDNIYAQFITDCNWLIWDLKGKIKLKADKTTGSMIGFRAWEPNRHLGEVEYRGLIIYRDLSYPWARDYLVFANSAYLATFPDLNVFPSFPGWNYGIHFNELGGQGFPNAGAIMRVWGPAQIVRLMHGEAIISHGDKVEYVKVDENNYLLYPPWEITLF